MKLAVLMKQPNPRRNHSLLPALVAFGLMAVSMALADTPASTSEMTKPTQQDEVLRNTTVIEMQKLGLGEDVLLEKIKTSRCDFDLNLEGLKQLKAAAVPDSVIKAMLSRKSAPKADSAVAEQGADANDPQSPHEAGIWLCEDQAGKPKMTKLEPSVYSQSKTGAGLFAQVGVSTKRAAVIRGTHAELETKDRRPIFYFYFEKTQSGLSDTRNTATSPNEYVLARFEVKDKEKQRRLVVGESNAYAGTTGGAGGKSICEFGLQKIVPGIYKVSPKEDMSNGEYGFYYGENSGTGKVFDFRVNGSPETEPAVPMPKDQTRKPK